LTVFFKVHSIEGRIKLFWEICSGENKIVGKEQCEDDRTNSDKHAHTNTHIHIRIDPNTNTISVKTIWEYTIISNNCPNIKTFGEAEKERRERERQCVCACLFVLQERI
jgi:hypothetical protein